MSVSKLIAIIFIIASNILFMPAIAAPPFLSDDADPADYRQLQIYPYANTVSETHSTMVYMPSLEFDYGLIPHVEFHIVFALATYLPESNANAALQTRATGLGDTEIGLKIRLLKEAANWPGIAIAPTAELPTGNSQRLLGNGRTWYKLPLWIQKNMGTWITYGGGGFGFNGAPNMQNYLYGGWLIQRNFNEHFSLGGELYYQGATANFREPPLQDNGPATLINFGAIYNMSNNQNISFSIGHSIKGVPQWVGYAGFYFSLQT